MVPIGILAYFLTEMEYPIAPLVIGVILGPMADANLRRALMVSKGSFLPVITRPVSLTLVLIILLTVLSQTRWYKTLTKKIVKKLFAKKKNK
jgi:putative tricarboxylic transport membrane protein